MNWESRAYQAAAEILNLVDGEAHRKQQAADKIVAALRDMRRETVLECCKISANHKASEISYPEEWRSQFTAEELDTMMDLAEHLFNQATKEVSDAIKERFDLSAAG